MLHPVHVEYAKNFFDTVPAVLEKVECIPLILVGWGVGEGHHAKGAYALFNTQDKSDLEMLQLLKHIVEKMEKGLQ